MSNALAMAVAIKRKNAQKKAMGGMIKPAEALSEAKEYELGLEESPPEEAMEEVMPMEENMGRNMAKGGMMDPDHIASKIMAKRMAKGGMCYEAGGMVDDFLSDEESDIGPEGEGEFEEDREGKIGRRGVLHRIMGQLHSAHSGK